MFINQVSFVLEMQKRYTLDSYLKFVRFVKAVESRDIDISNVFSTDFDVIAKKRDLLALLHTGLIGVGGVHIPLSECNPARICTALKSEYSRAKRAIEVYEGVRAKNVVSKMGELLSLEERAKSAYDKLPLFNKQQYDAAQDAIRKYVATLVKDDKDVLKDTFGDKVATYLTNQKPKTK